jgi:hypothetical protein
MMQRARTTLGLLLASALALGTTACGGDDDDGGGATPDAAPTPDAGETPDASPSAIDPVTGASATYTGPCDNVDLAWTNPAGADRIMIARQIVRVGTAADVAPVDGTTYGAGDDVPGGATVVFDGEGAAFADTDGFFHGDEVVYTIFAYDAAHTYSNGVAQTITVDQSLGDQLGKLSVNLGDNTVTVTNPANFTVAATANFDAGNTTLTVDVTMTNGACRAVHNPKLLATTLNDADAVAAGDFAFGAEQALYFGPAALADAGTSETRTFTFTNVDGATDPFDIDVSVIDSPTLILNGNYDDAALVTDSTGPVDPTTVDLTPLEFGGGDSTAYEGAVSPDGELLYLGHGQQPQIVTVDLTTLTAVGGADLTGADGIANDGTGTIGYVASVTMSPDYQYLYAVLVTGEHRAYFAGDLASCAADTRCDFQGRLADINVTSADIDLIRLDRTTLAEVDRLNLLTASTVRPKASHLSMTPDGSLGAVAVVREGKVFLVNLETMTLVDGDPNTAGDQPFDVSASSTEPRHVAISPDGATLAVAYRGDGRGGPAHDESLDLINVADAAITPLAVTTPTADNTDNLPAFLTFGPDGKLYYGRKDGAVALSVFDLAGPTEVEIGAGTISNAMTFAPDGSAFAWTTDGGTAVHLDLTTGDPIPLEATGADTMSNGGGFGHMCLLSPL